MSTSRDEGGVLALVALFLPVAILVIGMVLDLGVVFYARRATQTACDLGALAGVIELDWDALAQGDVRIDSLAGEAVAIQVTNENVVSLGPLIVDPMVSVRVFNIPEREEPTVQVYCHFRVRAHFLGFLPGFGLGIPCAASAEASVVMRTKW